MRYLGNSLGKIGVLVLIVLTGWGNQVQAGSFSHISSGNGLSSALDRDYVIILKEGTDVDSVSQDLERSNQLGIREKYRHVVKGFTASVPEKRLQKLRNDPRVAVVSEDRPVTALGQVSSTGMRRITALPAAGAGNGVAVAILDTGIDLDHPDLADRITANTTCVRRTTTGDDDNGHGSHVAGIVAASDNTVGSVGVAPGASLVAVKVLDRYGSGSWSSIICGIDWVTANAASYNIKVANMSIGGGGQSDNNCGALNADALHRAICNSVAAGVTYVVAAGNSGVNASQSVPAAYDDAVITVSALADSDGQPGGLGSRTSYGRDDTFASFSNFGSVVDLAAPGVGIYSTYKRGRYTTMTGTSMASPFVAGAAARYLAGHPGTSWQGVRDALRATAEPLGSGHTDPTGKFPEPVLRINGF